MEIRRCQPERGLFRLVSELVRCTAIGAVCISIGGDFNIYPGVQAPERGMRAWAVDRQVGLVNVNNIGLACSLFHNGILKVVRIVLVVLSEQLLYCAVADKQERIVASSAVLVHLMVH